MAGEFDVVAGAGPLGSAVATELIALGRRIRVVSRDGRHTFGPQTEGVAADLTDPASAAKAFAGASVVYNCASPPYPMWADLVPPLMNGIIGGAASAGVSVVYGDNLYCYGPVDGLLTEDRPYRPNGRGAAARAEAADALMAAHHRGDLRAAIGRASDFFGPTVLTSFMGDRVFPNLLAGKAASVLPGPDTPHSYTYIKDFGRALVTLGSRQESMGQVWHVPNADTVTTRQFVEIACAQLGVPPKISVLPKLMVRGLALFNPTMKVIYDRLYQTERPFVVDHSKFAKAFGADATPLSESIGQTLDWYRARG